MSLPWALPIILGAALVAGCTEAPEVGRGVDAVADARSTPDGALSDAGLDAQPDAGRPVGSACAEDAECAGICIDDGAGLRCAAACSAAESCAAPLVCRAASGRSACLAAVAQPHPEGAACADGVACEAGLACSPHHPQGPTCLAICHDEACGPGARCAPAGLEPRTCLPEDAAVFGCAVDGCARADLLCVVDDRPGGRCTSPCFERDQPCPDGGLCAARRGDGALYCQPQGDRELGESCASGGQAACSDGLSCTARGPGDPAAVCSRPCDGACPGDLACRRPTGWPEAVCVPAPFGVGDASGPRGADCTAHGATDCLPSLDCVVGVDGRGICAAACPDGVCEAGEVCADRRFDGPYCLPGGAVGTPCPDGDGCGERCVPSDDTDRRYCTQACGDCPGGLVCQDGWCALAAPGAAGALGAPCGADGVACSSGLCVAGPDGVSRCTEECGAEACPMGYDCEPVGDRAFCFPSP